MAQGVRAGRRRGGRRQPQGRRLRRGGRRVAGRGRQGCGLRLPRRALGRARRARRGRLPRLRARRRAREQRRRLPDVRQAQRRHRGAVRQGRSPSTSRARSASRRSSASGWWPARAARSSTSRAPGAVRPTSDIVPYAAAKAGVNAMTVGLAHAFGPRVRVNAIMPGPFLTTISQAWDMDVFAERARTFPARRAGDADEIVGAALYLASDASSYTTGTILTVDGGAQWSMAGTGEAADDRLEVRSNQRYRTAILSAWSHEFEAVVAQGRPSRRARHRRARRGGGPHGHVLRSRDEGHARDRRRSSGRSSGTSTRVLHLINLPAGSDIQAHARAAVADGASAQPADRGRRRAGRPRPATAPRRSTDAMAPTLNPVDLVTRVNRDVERSLLRARNGVRYVRGTHRRDKVGATPKEVVWRRGKAELWRYRNGTGPLRPARADRAQPREPQLHPRPAPGQQPGRAPHRRPASTCSCSTGASRTSSTPTTTSSATSTGTCRGPSRRCSARPAAPR